MSQATWLSFGYKKISKEVAMQFARKIREAIAMYITGLDGPFANYFPAPAVILRFTTQIR